jgi:cyclophilin family peptidyl-prolyl cis-trans isomerase
MKWLLLLCAVLAAITTGQAAAPDNPRVQMRTNLGSFVVELYPDKAPDTVRNFLLYIREGFYDGTIFHRLLPDMLVQGGGYGPDWSPKEVGLSIQNEGDNGLKNLQGTIAMVHDRDPHSATTQFVINLADNPQFDYSESPAPDWGNCVFGRVVEGMDTIRRMAAVPILSGGDFIGDVPSKPIVLEEARLLTE